MIATRLVVLPICMDCVSVYLCACLRRGLPRRMPRPYRRGHLMAPSSRHRGAHCGCGRRTGKMKARTGAAGAPPHQGSQVKGGVMAGIVVDRVYERRLAALVNSREQRPVGRGRRGLERESLRVTPDGHIAQTPHPRSLGASLTNPHITTDYSEALTELVTPTFDDNEELLQYLGDLHQFVYAHLGEELLWATSMPGILAGVKAGPTPRFGRWDMGG